MVCVSNKIKWFNGVSKMCIFKIIFLLCLTKYESSHLHKMTQMYCEDTINYICLNVEFMENDWDSRRGQIWLENMMFTEHMKFYSPLHMTD